MSKTQQRINQLSLLLGRGRKLHWDNHKEIARRSFRQRAQPPEPPPLVDFVYRAIQFVFAADLVSTRGYVEDSALSQFGQGLFTELAGQNGARFHKVSGNYVESLEADIASVFARDLCAAMTGETASNEVQALSGASRALQKMTQLYCARVFGDRELIARLS